MEYPLISEYKEAILSAEDNFNELSSLRPVLDSHGDPVMSSGNFAVVFKMREESDGKLYAVKCFIKDQEGRDESYRKIADELEVISSSYILPLRYLENELFVDSAQCDKEEFPVVVMEWVEGETLDAYLNRNLNDKYELEMLSYRFNRMAAWLLAQPFAHGDLKPDNILVRKDGSLVLVDYDGMFVPSMKGEKAREIGSPDYRHPLRTDADFDEHIDDFSIAVIALSLKAVALNPELKPSSSDSLLINENDYQSPSNSSLLREIQKLTSDSGLSLLLGIFYIALAKNKLDSLSFKLFITDKPNSPLTQNHDNHMSIIEFFKNHNLDRTIEIHISKYNTYEDSDVPILFIPLNKEIGNKRQTRLTFSKSLAKTYLENNHIDIIKSAKMTKNSNGFWGIIIDDTTKS